MALYPVRKKQFICGSFELLHKILVLLALASSKGSDEPACPCILVRDFAACINKMQKYTKARHQI